MSLSSLKITQKVLRLKKKGASRFLKSYALRVNGWPILTGKTIIDMLNAGEIPADAPEYTKYSDIIPEDVVLVDTSPDPDAPRRWRQAKNLRHP